MRQTGMKETVIPLLVTNSKANHFLHNQKQIKLKKEESYKFAWAQCNIMLTIEKKKKSKNKMFGRKYVKN